MNRQAKPGPSASQVARDEAHKHERVLLRAWQVAHPVVYQERERFIQTLCFTLAGGSGELSVFLTGSSVPVSPDELRLMERPV